jgi:hypothetical protein
MARTIEECRLVVEAQKLSGKKYCMMETTVFTREYLFVKDLVAKGELGRIQFIRAAHHQEMAAETGGATGQACLNALRGPLCRSSADSWQANRMGRAWIRPRRRQMRAAPFRPAVETTHMKLKDSVRGISAATTRRAAVKLRRLGSKPASSGSRLRPKAGHPPSEEAAGACAGLRAPVARADPALYDQGRV